MGDPRRIYTPSGRVPSCLSFFHATLLAFHTSSVCRIECSIPCLPCRGVPTDKGCGDKGCVCPKKTKETKDLRPKSCPIMTEFEKYFYFITIKIIETKEIKIIVLSYIVLDLI